VRGISLEPLHENVAEVARANSALAEGLALIDAIRLGDARIRKLAERHLSQHLRLVSAAS
jgi:hypothetical protein